MDINLNTFRSIVIQDERSNLDPSYFPCVKQKNTTTGTIYWKDNKGVQRSLDYDLDKVAENAYNTNSKWKAAADKGEKIDAAFQFIINDSNNTNPGYKWYAPL